MVMLPSLTYWIRPNSWGDSVIPKDMFEERYARLVVKAILGGIVPYYFREQVQGELSFQNVMEDPEVPFDSKNELTPM